MSTYRLPGLATARHTSVLVEHLTLAFTGSYIVDGAIESALTVCMLNSRAVDLVIPDARVVRRNEGRTSPIAISFRPAEREAQGGVVLTNPCSRARVSYRLKIDPYRMPRAGLLISAPVCRQSCIRRVAKCYWSAFGGPFGPPYARLFYLANGIVTHRLY